MPETEVATGTPQTGTPPPAAPEPAAPTTTTDIRGAAKDAISSIRAKQASAPASEPAKEPATATTEPARLLTKEEPQKPLDLSSIDWSKQPAEILALRKELLGDYTRKTQEAAELRKSLDEKLLQVMDRLAPKKEEVAVADPREQIRQLREEGRHDEADAMVLELSEKIATEKVAGLERQAQINELKTTFRDVVSETNMNSPVVNAYKDKVAEIFDGNHPAIMEFKKFALTSPEKMRVMVPALMNLLATEQHAIALEKNFNTAVAQGIEAGIKAEKAKAAGIRGPIVPSGGESRETPAPQITDIRRAVQAASRQIRGE